jgi:electron transfer flavoprotein beta subunit
VTPDGSGIDTTGVKLVCDPFDEFAVEQAVRLRESRSDVEEVVVLTVGESAAHTATRAALAMGADRAIHVCVESGAANDELLRAALAASAIRRQEGAFDLVLCGKQTIDRDAGEFGPALAELLGWPHVGAVTRLELADNGRSVRASRRIEGGEEIVEAPLPALLTCEKGLVEPRYPSLPNVMKAKKKPLETIMATDLADGEARGAGTRLVALSPPPERAACRMIDGEPEEMARELIRRLRDEAKVI